MNYLFVFTRGSEGQLMLTTFILLLDELNFDFYIEPLELL